MAYPLFAIFILLITGVPIWLRYQRNANASRDLAEDDDDAATLTPRERLALALAYPSESALDDRVHEITGDFEIVQAYGPDRRLYIGDLWVLIHESLIHNIELSCTARIVRARGKALVVELNGQPILPSLVDTRAAPLDAGIDTSQRVRILGETRESGADYDLRLAGSGVDAGCLYTITVFFICLGALILLLATPSQHPIWFGIGWVPLVFGILAYQPNIKFAASKHGERLFRLQGQVIVAEQDSDVPGADEIGHIPGNAPTAITRRLTWGVVKGPVNSVNMKWPVPLIGNVPLRYPRHWIDALRQRTPETVEVTITKSGEVVIHGALSRYDELRRFPPVHWLGHTAATCFIAITLAIAIYNDTQALETLANPETIAAWSAWLAQLPAALSLIALAGLGLWHGVWTVVGFFRWRDRRAHVSQWLNAR
ncbi:hypothetical protein V5738_18525 [Salinisphaera sp. SPP-AMP-43]|uniref:hypothetical protein n=1 Tax=Salinisphaera sp. SPP-AMP-43 TaxID=3121288 RepID=UPI003C6E63AD